MNVTTVSSDETDLRIHVATCVDTFLLPVMIRYTIFRVFPEVREKKTQDKGTGNLFLTVREEEVSVAKLAGS